MVAVSVVALPNAVIRFTPFHCTTDDETKLAPVTVSVNPGEPTPTLLGERLVTLGAGFRTDRLAAPDVPPPGAGVRTLMAAVPAAATSVAGIVALSSVGLTRVVGRAAPFHRTIDDATKPDPLTVSENPAPPALTLLGERPVTVGAGFRTGRFDAAEVPPPGAGVTTVITMVPAAMRSDAGIAAVRVVELLNVVT
jgi:hypothetical protein